MANDIHEALSRIDLFAPLGPDGIGRFVDVGRVEYWNAGSEVFEEGQTGPRMMVILDGHAEVFRTDPNGVLRSLSQVGTGDVLGEISMLLGEPASATVKAVGELRVFSIDRRAFQGMVDAGDPAALRFGLELARLLSMRIVRLNDVVLHLLMDAEPDELSELAREVTEEIPIF